MTEQQAFSLRNRVRCEHPQGFNKPLTSWSLSDWFTAVLGELGEAANMAKKLNRIRDGIPGNKEGETEEVLRQKLADELADTICYLDLLVQHAGLDWATIRDAKFAKTSQEIGYVEELASTGAAKLDELRAENAKLRQRAEVAEHTSRDFCEKWQIEYQRTNDQTRKLTAAEQELAQLRQRAEGAERDKENLTDSISVVAETNRSTIRRLNEIKADRDRLAAELAAAKEQLAAREGELERVRRACETTESGAQYMAILEGLEALAKSNVDCNQPLWVWSRWAQQNAPGLRAAIHGVPPAALSPSSPATQPGSPPAFWCPRCGSEIDHRRDPNNAWCEVLLCKECNWKGTFAEVAAAKASNSEGETA